MTEIFVIDYDAFVEEYENQPKSYFYGLDYDDLMDLCEEDIAEKLTPAEFEQRFNDGYYSGSDSYYIRIIETEEDEQ